MRTSSMSVPGPAADPLDRLADAFRALSERRNPLTLDVSDLGEGLPEHPLDMQNLRSLLLHPALGHQARGAVWARLLELTASEGTAGEDWRLAAVGMAAPGLVRICKRWCAAVPDAGREQRAEVQQAVLAGFWEALAAMRADQTWRRDPGRIPVRLLHAADRAVRTEVRGPRRLRVAEVTLEVVPAARPEQPSPEQLLAHAVRLGMIEAGNARLVLLSRLEGVPIPEIAAEWGCSPESLWMRRLRAEKRLARLIRSGELCAQDVELVSERLDSVRNCVS